jgi:uncharacterized protein (TIGR02611 family)
VGQETGSRPPIIEETGKRPPIMERVRARQERHRQRHRLYRIGFAALGFLVLAAGIVMLVTPGPGIPAIILGLAMLALEFAWAERWLERLVNRVEQAAEEVRQSSPAKRVALIAAGVLGVAAYIMIIVFWDIPILPG